jgi:hypothetical protein
MPQAGLEPTIRADQRLQTYVLERVHRNWQFYAYDLKYFRLP